MVAALPMQDRLNDCTIPAHDDLCECRTKDTLARSGGCSGMQPSALQISAELHQLLTLCLAERRRTPGDHSRDITLDLGNRLQCLVPASFQLASDQPVCRVDGVVLSARVCGFVMCLLQRQLPLAFGCSRRARFRLDCSERCFHAERLENAQDFVTNRRINAQAANRNAARGTVVRARPIAIVAAKLAAVVYMELATTVAASQ